MSRTFAIVSTCSQAGWAEYGERFARSFLERFPADVRLYFYIDFKAPMKTDRIVFRDLAQNCPELITFQNGLARFDFARGEGVAYPDHRKSHDCTLVWNAKKFSFKVYAVEHAVRAAKEDVMVWIDADVFAFADLDARVLEDTTPPDCMLSYLGRSWKFTECGYVGYNLRHPRTRAFVAAMAEMYGSGAIFSLNEWHDSYVFDAVRLTFERVFGVRNHNISFEVSDTHHVFINSVLGRYLDHMKGDRKGEGRSQLDEGHQHADVAYWRDSVAPAAKPGAAHTPGQGATLGG